MRISEIKAGERHRRDLGDIAGLAASIAEIGLLHPVVVIPDGTLIAGARRIAACVSLGWTDVPVTVVDIPAIVRGEYAENTCRKDFVPSEAVAIWQAMESYQHQPNCRPDSGGRRESRIDRAATVTQISTDTLTKAKAVVDAAEREPEKYGPLVEQMDRTGKVAGPYRIIKLAERVPAAAPPIGQYRCIVIDPPWPMQKIEREERPNQGLALDYPVMSLEEIEALPIHALMCPDGCHVYLWVTQKYLPAGLDLFRAWGIAYQCLMTWVKPTGMTPYSWMYNTEHVIYGHVGNLKLQRLGLKLSFEAPVVRHSQKPDVFYERVIAASPEPRLEMFSRQARSGFTAWGNEA